MSDIEIQILKNLVHDERFIRLSMPYLKEEYFSSKENKTLYNEIRNFFEEYNNTPTITSLSIIIGKIDCSEEEYKSISSTLDHIKEKDDVQLEWLIKETEKFCQDKAIYNAIMDSIKILDNKTKEDKGAIPGLLQNALSVCFDPNIGHDFIEDSEERFEFYHEKLEKIPFDIDYLNKITRGGLPKKSLSCILASTGVGKSLMMCHMSAANILSGYNVLYITLEMAEERIAERIDANLMNIDISEFENIDKEIYTTKIESLKNRTKGKLIIKEYPTASAGANHFRYLLNELRMKKKFQPDIIYIDYINLCMSSRLKLGSSVNSYTYIKSIAEELRGLAVEYNLPIVTATQVNRDGSANSDMDMTDTGESWGLPQTLDFYIAAITSEELEEMGQIMIKQLKNRYNDIAKHRRFVVGIDKSKMKLFDVEQNFNDRKKEIEDKPVMDNTNFGAGLNKEKFDRSVFESWM